MDLLWYFHVLHELRWHKAGIFLDLIYDIRLIHHVELPVGQNLLQVIGQEFTSNIYPDVWWKLNEAEDLSLI